MRVLHVISTLAKTSGGPTEVLYNLASYQRRAGLEVTVCTTNRGNPTSCTLDIDEIRSNLDAEIGLQCFTADFVPMLIAKGMRKWLRNKRMQNLRRG